MYARCTQLRVTWDAGRLPGVDITKSFFTNNFIYNHGCHAVYQLKVQRYTLPPQVAIAALDLHKSHGIYHVYGLLYFQRNPLSSCKSIDSIIVVILVSGITHVALVVVSEQLARPAISEQRIYTSIHT